MLQKNLFPALCPNPTSSPALPRATSTLQAAATHCSAPSARMDRGMPLVAVHPCCALLLPACHGNMRSRDGAIDNVRARESTRGAWTHEQTDTARQRARPAPAGCTALGTSGSGGDRQRSHKPARRLSPGRKPRSCSRHAERAVASAQGRTARSVFSERSRKVGCFLHSSWYTCARRQVWHC